MTPRIEGYYWARWTSLLPVVGDFDLFENMMWAPVEVFNSDVLNPEGPVLMVAVLGLWDAQPLEGFEWGSAITFPSEPYEPRHAR